MNKKIASIIQRHAVLRHAASGSAIALMCFAASIPCQAGQKPADWDAAVGSAGKTPPIFWLDGNYTPNKGSALNGEVTYLNREQVWDQLQTGFWGEENGAFRIVEASDGGRQFARVGDSKTTKIACSESGSLAILFKTASEFRIDTFSPPDKHALLTRGDFSTPSPFEIAIVNGMLRVLTLGESGKPLFTTIANVNPASWYWVAMSWMKKDGVTHVQWRVKDLSNNAPMETGTFQAQGMGDVDSFLHIGLTQSKHSAPDTAFSQIIVWDTPIADEAWGKIETLLK